MSNEAQLIQQLVQNEISDEMSTIYTGFPATVVSYDNQLATIKPVMSMRFSDGDIVELPTLVDVPVIFPSGGGGILSFPIKKGDPVWVQCSTMSMEQWREVYQLNTVPDTRRTHSINDAVCFPCVFPENIRMGVSGDNVEIVFNNVNEETKEVESWNSTFRLQPDGGVLLGNRFKSQLIFGADKSITVRNVDSGASVVLKDDGNIEITTAQTIRIQNSGEELVSLASELMQLLIDTTVNTSIGPMPLNTKAQITALKTRLDTLKA